MSEVDALQSLLLEFLDRVDRGEDAAALLAELVNAHPEQADALRRRLSILRGMGMLGGSHPTEVPERLGEFRLRSRLGGGGMGVVYLAEQEGLERLVALKVIHPAQLFFEGARERFRREVEAVASLQHPGIVPVYTVGETDGVPYFAMERVAGCTLAELLDEVADRDPSRLQGADMVAAIARRTPDAEAPDTPAYVFGGTWEEAGLHLARQIADALHHAHRRGVLHRDVKPSNIMVTLDGRAMLLDFGLASAEGGASLTRSGSPLGSLPYMSPEQARGETGGLDARTDVYALGVTLYELLALRPAFEGGSSAQTVAAIQQGRRTAPRQVNPSVSWEAETVCLTAMDPDPARRYGSAADLHRDLGNVIEHRPVEARRASALLRVRRWAQRRPAAAVALLLGTLLLVGGPGLYAWQQRRARLLVGEEQARTEEQRALAEANFQQALKAVDTMLTRVSSETLRNVPETEEVRRELLDDAIAFYRGFLEQEGQDPRLLVQISRALQLVGEMHWQMGDYERARAVHEESVGVLERLIAAHPELPEPPRDLAMGVRKVALQIWEQGDVEAGIAQTKRALELMESLLERDDGTREDRAQLGLSLSNYGGMVSGIDLAEAERALRRGAEVFEQLAVDVPDEPGHRYDRATCLASLAAVLGAQGRMSEAYRVYEDTIEGLEALVAEHPEHTQARLQLGLALLNYGTNLGLDRESLARSHLARAIELTAALAADFPKTPSYLKWQAQAIVNLGLRHTYAGEYAAAEDLFRRGDAIQTKLLPMMQNSPALRFDLGLTRNNLAGVVLEQGKLDSAREVAQGAIEIFEALLVEMPGHPQVLNLLGNALHNLGEAHWKEGDFVAATEALEQSVARSRAALDGNPTDASIPPSLREHYRVLCLVHQDGGDHAGAAERAEELVEVQPDAAPGWAQAAGCMAACVPVAHADASLAADERLNVARRYADRAVEMLRRALDLGWIDPQRLDQDDDWASLRELDAFAELVAAMPPATAP